MNDLEFVRKCVKADRCAWDEFVERYSRLIYNYIHRVIEVKGFETSRRDHIRDIFQDIFLSLVKDDFRKLKTFQGKNGCSLASWLRQVTINATLDYLRRHRGLFSLDADTEEGFAFKDTLEVGGLSADAVVESEERFAGLRECINALDTEDRYFIELHIYRGLELDELKAYFKVSRGAIDMRKTRIIAKLRRCFQDKGFIFK